MLVGYVRVSTNGQNPSMQIEELKKLGVKEEHIFMEKRSGKTMDRDKWNECMKFLREGDTLVLWSIDRMGRTTGKMIVAFEELKARGIHITFAKGLMAGVDATTPVGKMFFGISAQFAENDRIVHGESCEEGRIDARRRGVKFGRKKKEVDMELFRSLVMSGKSRKQIREVFKKSGNPIGRNKFYECMSKVAGDSEGDGTRTARIERANTDGENVREEILTTEHTEHTEEEEE